MRLSLAAMPWLAVDTPSLALGILRRRVNEACPSIVVSEYHGGLRWTEHLLRATGGDLTPSDYYRIADKGLGYGLGDWVFADALYGDEGWRVAELREHARHWSLDLKLAERMRELAGGFVSEAADELLERDVDVVGFTTTFMQTVPSLALARELKRRKPSVRIVLGGANCDGPMGAALHRNHRFIDFVVRGEGEVVFPQLLGHLEAGTQPRGVPGVCWWDGTVSVANPEAAHSISPTLIPMPDYDEWFACIAQSPISEYITPFLYLEGSRGCWWGEKHQCTFCGLNGSLIDFRSKPADRFWDELTHLVARHRILDVMTADNIIDMSYYRELLPRMAASGWDLRLQFEAKANVRADQIALLAAAGVCAVQYGIESLNSNVLKLMDKGVTAATNVRVMRDSEDHHITVKWNYLYGFPGERPEDYLPVIEQMPALAHLQPPMDASRIALERFSPYFDRPELGFERRRPAEFYGYVYDLPESELMDLAYFFDTGSQGINGDTEKALFEAIARWQEDYLTSSLFRVADEGGALRICDRRRGWPVRDHVFEGWQRAAYEALDRPRSARALQHLIGVAVGEWLAAAVRDGLVFVDGDSYVALATRDVPVRVGG